MFDFAPQRPEPDVVTHLRKSRALLAKPENWCRGTGMMMTANGTIAHCAANALAQVGGETVYDANHLFSRAIPNGKRYAGIPEWNDEFGRTHAEVLAAFDAAIALGLAEHAPTEVAHV